ncbi:hypothetical protein SLEP1_g25144 [Rubroshorea leprosula]|uniref:KIB1-4 beta-propeller domain-containing protein n=1 Tax=Rubroshorea leprosula TaxID=152421 RepID=A0AAV5JSG3_9ROSI|nr:hypothetical protein SLEP1_g25144 [Rubroshorea leprosula]
MTISTPIRSSDASVDEFHQRNRISSTLHPTSDVSLGPIANRNMESCRSKRKRNMESSSMDWELLSNHILDLIHDKLVYLVDYIYFGAVCKEWRSVAQDNRKRRRTINASHPHQPPLLLVPIKDKDEKLIYSITQDRVSNMRLRVPFNKRYYGSSYGSLIDMDETFSIILLNPFLEKVIKPPPMTKGDESTTDHEPFILKAILSNDPDLNPNDFMVAIIYNGMRYLAVYKSSPRSWTYLHDHPNGMGYRDIIHHKGDFYAIDGRLGVGKIDVAGIEKCPRPQGLYPSLPGSCVW